WCRRNPAVAALLTAVAVMLVVGTVVAAVLASWALGEAGRAVEKAGEAERAERRASDKADEADRKARDEQLAKEKAIEAEKRKDEALNRTEWLLYISQIFGAQSAWDAGSARTARIRLEQCRWDFRNWEYRYLNALVNSNQRKLRGHTH